MNTVKCRYYAFKYSKILHKWLQQFRQNINEMLDPQKTPMGRFLWLFFRKPRYNSTPLYFHIPLPLTLESHGPLNRHFNWNSLPERSWNPPGLEHPSQNCGQLWDYTPQWQKKPALWTTGVVCVRDWIKTPRSHHCLLTDYCGIWPRNPSPWWLLYSNTKPAIKQGWNAGKMSCKSWRVRARKT